MPTYRQVKVSIDTKIAEAFKSACEASGVSMASELAAFMSERAGILNADVEKQSKKESLDTRGKRRRQVNLIIERLKSIKDFEEAYQGRIPSNLQEGQAYEDSGQSIDSLDEAINQLNDAY